jgi:hypothetical protein|tara:strand:+ start:1593 stop:1805 length:213 start_codon:yes stop_codon:yes gene_type:complete
MIYNIKERASNKAFAKISNLHMDIKDLVNDIKEKRTGGISMEQLELVLDGTRLELDTWKYIATLIEKNNI